MEKSFKYLFCALSAYAMNPYDATAAEILDKAAADFEADAKRNAPVPPFAEALLIVVACALDEGGEQFIAPALATATSVAQVLLWEC